MKNFYHCEIELGPEAESLSGQQKAVVLFLAAGLTNKAIARVMNRSPETIAMHVSALMAVFGVDSRAGIVGQAFCHGVLTPCAKMVAAIALGAALIGSPHQIDDRFAYRTGPRTVRTTSVRAMTQSGGITA